MLALAIFILELPEGWEQDPPSRLDMCRRCAELLEQVSRHCGGGGEAVILNVYVEGRI